MAAPSTLTNPTLTSSVHDRAAPSTNHTTTSSSSKDRPNQKDENQKPDATTAAADGGYINPFIQATPPISPSTEETTPVLERTNSLEKYLQHRPDAKDLRERGILLAGEGVSPVIQGKARELERALAVSALKKELSARSEKEDLIARNILPDTSAAPAIQAQQKELQKHMRMDSLEHKLAQRPTAEELVKEGILEKGDTVDAA